MKNSAKINLLISIPKLTKNDLSLTLLPKCIERKNKGIDKIPSGTLLVI